MFVVVPEGNGGGGYRKRGSEVDDNEGQLFSSVVSMPRGDCSVDEWVYTVVLVPQNRSGVNRPREDRVDESDCSRTG